MPDFLWNFQFTIRRTGVQSRSRTSKAVYDYILLNFSSDICVQFRAGSEQTAIVSTDNTLPSSSCVLLEANE